METVGETNYFPFTTILKLWSWESCYILIIAINGSKSESVGQ